MILSPVMKLAFKRLTYKAMKIIVEVRPIICHKMIKFNYLRTNAFVLHGTKKRKNGTFPLLMSVRC